jgi:hypothetical protein
MSSNEKFEREFEAFLNEEDSRLAALYRKLPRPEPDARLDAAVHAMAHRELNPHLVATPRASGERRRVARWVPALGAAAGVVLAAGIAFRLGPSLSDTNYRDSAPANDVITVHRLDEPPPSTPPLSPPPPAATVPAAAPAIRAQATKVESAPTAASTPPPAAATRPAPVVAEEQEKAAESSPTPERSAPAPGAGGAAAAAKSAAAPRPFPADTRAPRRPAEIDAVERKQIMAAGAWQKLHDQDAGNPASDENRPRSLDDKAGAGAAAPATNAAAAARSAQPSAAQSMAAPAAREAPLPAAPAPPPAQAAGSVRRDESAGLSDAGALKKERARSADPNARLYPEHWLANIRTMLEDGRRDEALRSLGEFRRMYPDYRLPDDLRDLK